MLCTPFINALIEGVHNEAGLLDIADYSGHVTKGFKKDSERIAKFFVPHIERLDPDKKYALFNAFNFFLSSYYYCDFPISSSMYYVHIFLGLTCEHLLAHPMSRRLGE